MGNGVKIVKRFFLGMLPVLAGIATAATFNLFQPATGILKGNASTYVTTAAASGDVIATFTGTCNNGTYLRGDGTCNTPPGTGVSSVGLTMPTGFSVAGSPVTSSGTLAVSTTLNGVLHGNGSGLSASNVLLGSEVGGTLPVANGGSGATSLTGLLTGNGTSAFTAATSANVISLWSGTCNSGSFLRGDGACAAAGTGSVTSVGLTMPGVFSVTGSPVTTSGTLAVAASGTSGGIPYFNSATTMASSAALAANQLVLGGGAGTTPATLGSLGTTATVLHGNAAGAPSFGAVSLTADVSGTLPVLNGGTGVTSKTGTGSVVLSDTPTFTGTVSAATIAATTVTVGGNNVCQSTGTNCPSSPTLAGSNTWTGTNNFTVVQPQFNGNTLTSVVNFAASFVSAAGGCSNASNVTSCVHNSTGYYTITLTSGISNMKCAATADATGAAVRIPLTHTTAFTTVDVRIVDASATLTDNDFNIICIF